jgi:hypothetical protein
MLKRSIIALGLVILSALVFELYARPEFILQIANQLWTCF